MKRVVGVLFFFFLLSTASLQAQQSKAVRATSHQNFIQNKGQVYDMNGRPADEVLFTTTAPGMDVFVTKTGITYLFSKVHKQVEKDASGQVVKKEKSIEWNRVDMQLVDATIQTEKVETQAPSRSKYHYYYKHAPQGIRDVQAFAQVTIKDIYPGIDWVLYASGKKFEEGKGGFKYDFVVHPGADVNDIKMRYHGATRLNVSEDQIDFSTHLGGIKEGKLFCYQTINDKRYSVDASYELSDNTIGYQISNIVEDEILVIDPPLVWATYVGGASGFVGPVGMEVDQHNNIFISGYLTSPYYPTRDPGTGAYYQGTKAAVQNTFVSKFDEEGFLLWSTYYGGGTDESDKAEDMCIDAAGDIYITGSARNDSLPVLDAGGGAWFQKDLATGGGGDAFILKFDNNGVLKWATYYGGTNPDKGLAIHADANGSVYLGGQTQSNDFPLQNASGAYNLSSMPSSHEAFLVKFNSSLQRTWATYLGGNSVEEVDDIVSMADKTYVTGITASTDFPLLDAGGFYQNSMQGTVDAFVLALDTKDTIEWSSLFGGSKDDRPYEMTLDASNALFITGSTSSSDFNALQDAGGYYQSTLTGSNSDIFVVSFNANHQLDWGTYIGGNTTGINTLDQGEALLIDPSGNLYLTGRTYDPNFPTKDPGNNEYFDDSYNGSTGFMADGADLIIMRFDPNHALEWSTFYGGKYKDWGNAMVMDTLGCLYVTGEWWSDSVYTINPGGGEFYQDQRSSSDEGFILKFCDKLHVKITSTEPLCNGDATAELQVETLSGSPTFTYDWQPGGYSAATASNVPAGTYTLTVTDGNGDQVVRTVTIDEPPVFSLNSTPDTSIFLGDEATLIALASGGIPGYVYQWDGGSSQTDTTVYPGTTTTYTIQVTDSIGCTISNTVTVEVLGEDGPFPNIFTPNGDGANDVLAPLSPNISITEGYIYNRWGNLMYTWEPTSVGWDGRLSSGSECPAGTYFYIIKATSKAGDFYDLSGFITLLR